MNEKLYDMNTLLYGNGINITMGAPSWGKLLKKVFSSKEKETLEGVPSTITYETLFMEMPKTVRNNTEYNVKRSVVHKLKSFQGNLLKKMSSIPFDAYMTTNYDQSLEYYLNNKDKNLKTKEIRFSLFRKNACEKNGMPINIWHIHGDVKAPASIMLGFDQYCRYLRRIELYVLGKLKGISEVPLEQRIVEIQNDINVKSWIDLFFLSDIYIVGFGLDYSEIDIWWLLCHRARLIRKGMNIKNHIFFYDPFVSPAKRNVLEALGVQVIDGLSYYKNSTEENFYKKWYNNVFDSIERKINR